MEAEFVGRLGQKMRIIGNPTEVATAYAYLMAADVQGIRALDEVRLNNQQKNGGYADPPMDILKSGNAEDIINGLLDWVIEQRKKENGDDGDE